MTDTAQHELMHPTGDEAAWSESYYFNFVDPNTGIGMFTRMGFRPGDGWADALHAIYLPGSRVAFTYGRRDIGEDLAVYNGDLTAGHLTITTVEPMKQWRIEYDGPAQDIADGAVLVTPRKERDADWFAPGHLRMQLTFDCLTEPYFTHSEDGRTGAYGHFEQSGRVHGRIELSDDVFEVDGFGVRDKSWGPRDWGAGQRDEKEDSTSTGGGASFSSSASPNAFVNWFSMNFGADCALGGSCFRQRAGEMKGAGWIQRDGKSMRLRDVRITTDYRPDSILHKSVRLTGSIETDDGPEPVEITGEVINMCPTKVPMPGGATFINEGLGRFQWGEKTGYGIAEHWHAVRKS